MAYSRLPQTVLAGIGLKQNPLPSTTQPAGIVPVTLDVNVATINSLGVVQVGSGLTITPGGVLSATSETGLLAVKLVNTNYTATATDCFIGATKKDSTITLTTILTGKYYCIKNQATGEITVTSPQKIDSATSIKLGTNESIIVVFDGTRWNTVQ